MMKQKLNRMKQILMKRTSKILFSSLAIVLALAIGFLGHFQMFGLLANAEQAPTRYVSEVRVYRGKNTEAATSACKKDNFVPVKGNLNEGTGEDAVILGYTTTENKDEAITDVRMMQMTSGFSTVNYKEMLTKQYPGLDSLIEEQYNTIKEFRGKVESGSYNAKTALKFLNLFKIPELNMKLGDYYLSDLLNKEKLKQLFLQSAGAVSTNAYNQLALGVSDCSDDNWASRVYSNKDILDPSGNNGESEGGVEAGTDSYAELDRKYLSNAERLVPLIREFATKYQNGMARVEANGGTLPEFDFEKASDEEKNERGTESLYLTAYGILNQYKFNDEKLLGDWFVEMGNLTLSNKAELRELYPLIASMSYGQIITTQMVGFQFSAYYMKDLSGSEDEFAKTLGDAQNECRNFDNSDSISVWAGVDQKLFEQECAVTGDAQRYTNLKDTAENLVKRNRFIQVLEAISSICSYTSAIAGGAAALTLPNLMVGWFAKDAALWAAKHAVMAGIFAGLGKVAGVVSIASGILTIVILIIMLVVFLYDLLKPECDDLKYTTIPTVTMDLSVDDNITGNRGLLRYDLIQNPDGKADLNANKGKQWNALYSSQNTDAGKPIVVPDNGEPFIVKQNDAANPAGYKAVKNFDEIYAANLNANVKSSKAPAVYLFYSSPGESSGTTEVKDGDKPKDDSQGEGQQEATAPTEKQPAPAEKKQYIASVYLSSETSETIAKSKLTQQGYKIIDVNLSPSYENQNKAYTYLGYTVTTSEKSAVTDIRIAKIKSTSQAVAYGTVKYTAAGYDAHGNSICYTKDTSVGSPILADDIRVANKLSDGKKGYEAVSYFGGTAYNFDSSAEFKMWENAKYIFFSPSEKYTSGTEYISGLYFVSGKDAEQAGWSLTDYAQKLGGKLLGDADFTKGRKWQKEEYIDGGGKESNVYNVSDLKTYLCYTTTYNPKRAIYDVQFYAGTPRMQNFMTTLNAYTGNKDSNYAQTGYGITSVFMQCRDKMSSETTVHYEVNNYDDFTVYSGEALTCWGKYVDNIIPGVKWETTINQPRMLYSCGFKRGYKALVPGDLVLSSSQEAPEGFASIQDVKFPYEKKPLNLAYYIHDRNDQCSPAYLYINRAAPVKGKYIASVNVATYNPDPKWEKAERQANNDFSNDLCYIALLSSSAEIINQSLALFPAETWYTKQSTDDPHYSGSLGSLEYNTKATYLGVTYTDNPAKAVHGLLRLKARDGVTPTETLTVNGAKYSLVQNVSSKEPVPIYSANMDSYYLYTTTSSGGSSTGDPITGIQISEKVFEPKMSTVLTVIKGDTPAQKDFYGKVTSQAQYAVPYGDTNDVLFIHQKTNANLTGIDSFFVGVGDSESEAMKDLLTQGATNCLPLNLNKGSSSDACVFIGYHYYNPEYVNTRRTKYYMENAVKDLYVYVGDKPEKRLTIDKRKYTLCGNRNLNYGTGGTPMYLYQTTALINSKDKKDASYITSIAAAQYDRVPEDIAENRWENLLTTENKRINLNEGVRGFDKNDDKQHLVDSRVYVFIHRNDNYVKPEAVITGGYIKDTTIFGDVVLEKKVKEILSL